jgi:hypothetical protein
MFRQVWQMDLRLAAHNSRTAHLRNRGGRLLVLALWILLSCSAAAEPVRDYLEPADVRGGWTLAESNTESTAVKKPVANTVTYVAFDGQQYGMLEYAGFHVRVLLPSAPLNDPGFTADHLQELVDQLDLLYVVYRELLHLEPAGGGRLTVAFVPETCGSGCGLLGHKGVEILLDPKNVEFIVGELDAGRLHSILVHEIAHNFDAYREYLHYLPDHAHAWTDMFEYFAPYRYARFSRNDEAPDDAYHSPVSAVWKDYVTDASADWETCVKHQGCAASGLSANNLWAMPYYRIEGLHGVSALLGSFEFLADYARRSPPPTSAEEKEGLRILSLAAGAGLNIACYMDLLRWTLPQETRDELRQFGGPPETCQDLDQDGFSGIDGDCDDRDPTRNISAREIGANGLDDDCDELVDEQQLVEDGPGAATDEIDGLVPVQFPFEVKGSMADGQDSDRFQFALGGSGRARITLCADDEFRGWAVGLRPDGRYLQAPTWYVYQPVAGCASGTFDFGSLATGGVAIVPDGSGGGYSLTVSEASAPAPELVSSFQVAPSAGGGVRVEVVDPESRVASLGTEDVEIWVSGAGLQLTRPLSGTATFELSPFDYPQLQDGALYEVRMRPLVGGLPRAAFSSGQLFRFERTPGMPVVDDRFSGAWFDPGHEGEGFIVQVLEDDRAVVYWFTYTADGGQRWLLGTGAVRGSRIVVADLYDASGGRFGDGFDPSEVRLAARGSLEIAFRNCSEAVVNYLVDGAGGHQSLSRLTQLQGHRCGGSDTPTSPEVSGSWYDPAYDGQGFVVEQLDAETAVVYWFTYDSEGQQAWMVATGAVEDDGIHFSDVARPLGGSFGRSFDPGMVRNEPWGEMHLQLECSGGTAGYTPAAEGFTAGSQSLIPLARLRRSACGPH